MYNQGKRSVLSSQSAFAYNAVVTGTRGGRVVAYLNQNGTIGQAWQPVDAAQANMGSADHSNEEIVRQHHFREFGAGRGDDFSLIVPGAGASQYAFTLEDGTTTLAGHQTVIPTANNGTGIGLNTITTPFISITFVGTGLDVIANKASGGGSFTLTATVDGTLLGTTYTESSFYAALVDQKLKIVSGLPYGTHTVKFVVTGTFSLNVVLKQFAIYQPKKPSIPSGAVEIADYNVMADYVANNTQGMHTIATGVLRKQASREVIYAGSNWVAAGPSPGSYVDGWLFYTNGGTGQTASITFFGTGIELRSQSFATNSNNITVQVDGTTPGSVVTYGNWTYSAGILNQAASPNSLGGSGMRITGLTLGVHTLKLTNNNAGQMTIDTFDITTPIHFSKSNLYGDIQNTLPVGSCGISDNRKFTPVKDILPVAKAWSQAVGITSSPTTTSTIPVPMPDMSCAIKTANGSIKVSYSTIIAQTTATAWTVCQIYVDGIAVGQWKFLRADGTNSHVTIADSFVVPVSEGFHMIQLYWYVSGSTGTTYLTNRNLTVEEI